MSDLHDRTICVNSDLYVSPTTEITPRLLQLLRLNESNLQGSVNIGPVHKFSELASPGGFLLIHRQQDGFVRVCVSVHEHNPQHHTRSLARSGR